MTDGGPAFPVPGLHDHEEFNGMTLRDYFAAKALQPIISQEGTNQGVSGDLVDAQRAYRYADAMLAAREKSA